MFYLSPEGDRYYLNRAFDYNDRQYTRFAATHEKFTELGFTQVVVGPRPDDRFYIVSGPDDTGAYTATPRELEDIDTGETENVTGTDFKVYIRGLKFRYKEETFQAAEALLQPTDWVVVYNEEHPDSPLSSDALKSATDYRLYVEYIDEIRDMLIDACSTVEELKALVDAPVTVDDGYGNQIPNPDPYLPPFPPAWSYNYAEQTELYSGDTADARLTYLRARMTVRGIPYLTYGVNVGASTANL